ncbi:hypothetical protein [Sphingobium yanoikuyae]|uniref:hypothetical protein n=1 Tax=Sphingobium yanoikuyae TaxID=13690 RepID=UPI0005691E5C|nr:hypothetical protein [Sphingobium yanoikuyae]
MIGTISDLAKRPGMPSERAIRQIMKRNSDFPFFRRGTRGLAYLVDLDEAERFLSKLSRRPALAPITRSKLIKELGLDLLAKAERAEAEHGHEVE